MVSEDRRWKEKAPGRNRFLQIEHIYSRVQQPCKFIGTRESVYIRKLLNSYKIGLVHRQVRRFMSCAYALYLTLVCCLLFDC